MFGLADERVIVRNDGERRLLSRVVLDKGRDYGLCAHGVADNHLHVVLACDRAPSGRFAQRTGAALRCALGLPVAFRLTRIKPVDGQGYFRNAFFYALRQQEHHGLRCDPLHEGSNLTDLVGMRVAGAYTRDNVRALLPRIRDEELGELLGIAAGSEVVLATLADSAAAALALADLRGNASAVVAARRAAVHAARAATVAEVGAALQTSQRTVVRLRAGDADPALVRAVTLQWRMRSAARRAAARRAVVDEAPAARP
jgi:hypothetical protein